MRKLLLVLLVVAVTSVVAWLALRSDDTRCAEVAPRVEPAAAQHAPIELVPSTEAPRTERAAPAEPADERPRSTREAAVGGTCATFVVVPPGGVEAPENVEFVLVDALARRFAVESDSSANRACGLAPGEHRVQALLHGWTARIVRFDVSASEQEKRVEIPIVPLRDLVVRWRTDDGRPMRAALDEVGSAPAILVELGATFAPVAQWSEFQSVNTSRSTGLAQFPLARATGAKAGTDEIATIPIEPSREQWIVLAVGTTVVAVEPVPPSGPDVVLRTPLDALVSRFASVRSCVVAAGSREPLTDAKFEFENGLTSVAAHATGNDGCIPKLRLLAGTYRAKWSAPGRATVVEEIDVPAGVDTDLGLVELEPQCSLVVRVVDESGAPVPHAELKLSGDPTALSGRLRSGADGRCEPIGIGDESLTLSSVDESRVCWPSRISPCESRDPTRNDEVTVKLLPAVAIALDFGLDTTHTGGRIVTPDGVEVSHFWIGADGLVPLRLPRGRYVVESPAGSNAIEVGATSAVYEVR